MEVRFRPPRFEGTYDEWKRTHGSPERVPLMDEVLSLAVRERSGPGDPPRFTVGDDALLWTVRYLESLADRSRWEEFALGDPPGKSSVAYQPHSVHWHEGGHFGSSPWFPWAIFLNVMRARKMPKTVWALVSRQPDGLTEDDRLARAQAIDVAQKTYLQLLRDAVGEPVDVNIAASDRWRL